MKDSQQEIKSTVTVNTSDIAAKAHESKQDISQFDKISRKHGCKYTFFNILLKQLIFKEMIQTYILFDSLLIFFLKITTHFLS